MNLNELRSRYRQDILRLAAKYKLEDVRVFGSTVRGDAREDSDIDLLVHPQKGCSLMDIVGFELEISQIMGSKRVDVVEDEAVIPALAPFIFAEATAL